MLIEVLTCVGGCWAKRQSYFGFASSTPWRGIVKTSLTTTTMSSTLKEKKWRTLNLRRSGKTGSSRKKLNFVSLLQISEEISEFYRTYRNVEVVSFYKVPFLSALDLVQTRQVVIKGVSSLAHLTCTWYNVVLCRVMYTCRPTVRQSCLFCVISFVVGFQKSSRWVPIDTDLN